MPQPKILCVVGPTACGKTKMGVLLARRYGGEVVSVDSMQIYRGMAIGTAAPTPEEMEGIPHHMVGVADPAESWSVARFVSEADTCVQDILRRGRRPILVGGTGLYLESLIRGTDFAAGSAGGVTRQRLQQRLAAVSQGRTLILVTHRLSMLRMVDKLAVMENGRLRMFGPRDAILKRLRDSAAAARKPAPEKGQEAPGGAAAVKEEKDGRP